uniref:Uncharacterized protein n=1 Tax=Magallana gigas TaxID=29159 RepID=K1QHY2_MAGGI
MMWLVEFDVPTEVLPPCGEDSDACTKQVVWALLSRVVVTGWDKDPVEYMVDCLFTDSLHLVMGTHRRCATDPDLVKK